MSKSKKYSNENGPHARSDNSVPAAVSFGVLTGVALLVATTFIAYLPSLSCGFIWDDDSYVTDNQFIKAADGLYKFWCTREPVDYYPISNTMLWIEWRLWEMNATGYHTVSLIIHIIEALLIWVILRKLSIPGAFFAAMIFAVHPVNVEAVAWIAQRKDMLAFLFFLLSILWYLKAEMPVAAKCTRHTPRADHARAQSDEPAHGVCGVLSSRWYWLSLAAFVLAMLSKGSVAMLPVLLLGFVWWMRPLTRWDLVRIMPFFIVALALTGLHVWFQTQNMGEVIRTAGFLERLLGAGGVVWFYLYKALLPINLVFVYPQWNIEAVNPLWWLPLLTALILTAVLWWYKNGWSRPLLFAWCFFCVALVPVMGFADVFFLRYSLVADHYQHIAILGAIALASAGWSIWHKHARRAAHQAAMVAACVAVGSLAFLTWRQCGIYHDEITLYKDTLDKNPDAWMASFNLGCRLLQRGQTHEAIKHFQQALRIKADLPDVHNNLGRALVEAGRPDEAIEHCRQALRLQPDFPEAHYYLGNALLHLGRHQEAMEHYGQALRLKPDYPEVHNNLGLALVQTGRPGEAIEHYRQALKLKSDYFEAHNNIGIILAETGRPAEAIEHYRQALRLKSDYPEAYNNLGIALVQIARPAEAIEQYRQALRFAPDFTEAYYNLALAYASIQRSSEAIATSQKALEFAKLQGNKALTKQIEDWLNSYQGPGARGRKGEGVDMIDIN